MKYVVKSLKNLEYWKKELIAFLNGPMKKSRGLPIGTVAIWKGGKKYKKISSKKWARFYENESGSRGESQAIRNVVRKIENASSMEELVQIIKDNRSRFVIDGKPAPVVKQFMEQARKMEPGKKVVGSSTRSGSVAADLDVKQDEPEVMKKPESKDSFIPEPTDEQKEYANKALEGEFEDLDSDTIFKINQYIENPFLPEEDRLSKEEMRDLYIQIANGAIESEKGRGKDKQKRKERSDKGKTKEQAKEDLTYEESEGMAKFRDYIHQVDRDKLRQALLTGRKEELEGKGSVLEIFTGELISRNTDILINKMIDTFGVTKEEVLRELGIGIKGKDKIPTKKTNSGEKQERKKPEEYDPTLDPNSEEYKYRDTGYIAGSRKEEAAQYISQAKKDGELVRKDAVDWVDLEKNPREAEELITKSNLFGQVDWESLENDGMEPDAGFLIDRVYASIGAKPENNPRARQDYAYGIQSIRERMEKCKTANDVTTELSKMKEEYLGVMLQPTEADRIIKINEERNALLEISEKKNKIWKEMYHDAFNVYNSDIWKLERAIESRKRRGWTPKPELEKELNELKAKQKKAHDIWRDYRDKNPELDVHRKYSDKEEQNEFWSKLDRLYNRRKAIETAAKIRNLEQNEETRAWRTLGDKFLAVIDYRGYHGSNSFKNHVTNAKMGKIDSWDWAKKKDFKVRKATEKAKRFQLKVAEKYTRKGGKVVSVDSTKELKDMFNLRDVQSGNWVLKDPQSAKFHVEKSAEAFQDLSDMTGIPVDKISLNGRLALALGARGRGNAGFAGAAKAHYEPVQRVINITKMGGGGSLAHEWFHALDNMIRETAGFEEADVSMTSDAWQNLPEGELKSAYGDLVWAMTQGDSSIMEGINYSMEDYKNAKYNFDNPRGTLAKKIKDAGNLQSAINEVNEYVSPRLADAMEYYKRNPNSKYAVKSLKKAQKYARDWKKVVAAYYTGVPEDGVTGFAKIPTGEKGSQFLADARDLDSGSKGKVGYWSSTPEMAARAFAGYIEDKLNAEGRTSDYLTVYTDNKFYKDPFFGDDRPYPEGEERKRINSALERLFDVIIKDDMIRKSLGI